MHKRKTHTAKPRHTAERPRAVTADILSSKPLGQVKINPKWQKHYARLADLLNHFTNKKDNLTRDALEEQPTFSEHMADAGTDTYDRDFALSMLSSEQSAIYEIEQAIQRIENGTYGVCEMTGKTIQANRLNAIPWARFTVEAERQLEQNGTVARTKLGTLGSVSEGSAQEEESEETGREQE
jgi:DnaK suppressor protein